MVRICHYWCGCLWYPSIVLSIILSHNVAQCCYLILMRWDGLSIFRRWLVCFRAGSIYCVVVFLVLCRPWAEDFFVRQIPVGSFELAAHDCSRSLHSGRSSWVFEATRQLRRESQSGHWNILNLLQVHLGFTVDCEQLWVTVLISIDLARVVSHRAGNPTTWTSDSLGCIPRTFCNSAILNLQQHFLEHDFEKGGKVRPDRLCTVLPSFAPIGVKPALTLDHPFSSVFLGISHSKNTGWFGSLRQKSWEITRQLCSYQFTELHVARYKNVR